MHNANYLTKNTVSCVLYPPQHIGGTYNIIIYTHNIHYIAGVFGKKVITV